MSNSKITVEKPYFSTCYACHLKEGDWFIPANQPERIGLVINDNVEEDEWGVMYISEKGTGTPHCYFDVISYLETNDATFIRIKVNMTVKAEII